MARKARAEVEGGLYHVITRGNNRRQIFDAPADYEKFLSLLAVQKARLVEKNGELVAQVHRSDIAVCGRFGDFGCGGPLIWPAHFDDFQRAAKQRSELRPKARLCEPWVSVVINYGTKDRLPLITKELRPDLHRYLGGLVNRLHGTPLEINGMADHVHVLARIKPVISISEFLGKFKSVSSGWANRQTRGRFKWQVKYGAFTVSQSQVERVREYIRN